MGDIYGKSVYDELVKNSELYKGLLEENKSLREENSELKSELSKFRDSFKKYRDYEKEELAESCYDLARENEKLKADTEHTIKFNNKIIGKLKLENDKLKEENKIQKEYYIIACEKVNKLEEENKLLKQCLDKLMFTTDVVNVKIHGELGDYVYVRSDKQLKLNIED